MWPETKEAVRRAFWICEMLWGLPDDKYGRLLKETGAVKFPTKTEVRQAVIDDLAEKSLNLELEEVQVLIEDRIIAELKSSYAAAGESAGLTADHGLAMLEYVALLKELEDE